MDNLFWLFNLMKSFIDKIRAEMVMYAVFHSGEDEQHI